jgi:hypothetical protein
MFDEAIYHVVVQVSKACSLSTASVRLAHTKLDQRQTT